MLLKECYLSVNGRKREGTEIKINKFDKCKNRTQAMIIKATVDEAGGTGKS